MKIAIIGASKDKKKHSNKAVRAYKNSDHVVFPVNPTEREIEGLKCYASVREIPLEIDAASIYLPPEIGIKVVDEIIKRNIPTVYLNPGSESKEIVAKLKKNKVNVVQQCSIREIDVDPDNL